VPRVYLKSDKVQEATAEHVQIEDGLKYFINVGSVGQPRDGDWRAAYVLYDLESHQVTFRRVEYDIATTQKKILDAGLPEMLAHRIAEGR
jgi:diadenosine tetraphosphatase ApaH/serine/threonine PP2A family protein phosphatase